jgi:adenylosuccinate lyase
MAELPFMATENILMDAVLRGGDRQQLHERIREHSMAAGRRVKEEGADNDLLSRIAADPAFGLTQEQLNGILRPRDYVGRAPEQTAEYAAWVRENVLEPNRALLNETAELNV